MSTYAEHFKDSNVAIDSLYKHLNNPNFKQRLKDHFQNRIRFLGSHYRFQPNAAQVESYSDRIIENKIKEKELEKSISFCVNYLDAFPSWSAFYNVVKTNSKHLTEKDSKNTRELDQNIINAEYGLENDLRKRFIDVFGMDGLKRYVEYYTTKVVGWVSDNHERSIDFTRSALFDWHDSYYDPKKVKDVYDEKFLHISDKRVYFKNENGIPDILKKYNNTKRW